jgi:two-component system chemotaxis response regulator CheB
MKRQIKVLIVDDSAFIRKALEMMINENPQLQVVGTAKNGLEGVELCKKLNPDVVTMDVEMPVMNGLDALKKIMTEHPTPVIMVSTLTEEGAEVTLKALENGAVDFIPKKFDYSTAEIIKIKKELYAKLISVGQIDFKRKQTEETTNVGPGHLLRKIKEKEYRAVKEVFSDKYKIIAIASSTGGPMTLQKILPQLPANLPVPVIIAQHMPPVFTKSFATRLNEMLPLRVVEAENNMEIEPGTVYIGKGGYHIILKEIMNKIRIKLIEDMPGFLYKPSGDLLFESVAKLYGSKAIGIILTGMGSDGANGLLKLYQAGAYTIAQDESTSVIYGMPKAAAELGAAKTVLPVYQIPDKISLLLSSTPKVKMN